MEPSIWQSYHLFYHGDRDLAVRAFVRPTVCSLMRSGVIDSFFFVRYGLGGPHLRLRVKSRNGGRAVVSAEVEQAASRFFARHPSMPSLSVAEIRRHNRLLLENDPSGGTDEVFANHTCVEVAPVFEVDRYGGRELIEHSMDYFALSSCYTMTVCRPGSRSRRLGEALRVQACQARGLSLDGAEFLEHVSYPDAYWGTGLEAAISAGDQYFNGHADEVCTFLEEALHRIKVGGEAADAFESPLRSLTDGATSLRDLPGGLGTDERLAMGMSHMHMTANRMGLSNPEEAYLGRILWRAGHALAASETSGWRDAWSQHARSTPPSLHDLRVRECSRLVTEQHTES